jgi:phosphoserine aminotransferase
MFVTYSKLTSKVLNIDKFFVIIISMQAPTQIAFLTVLIFKERSFVRRESHSSDSQIIVNYFLQINLNTHATACILGIPGNMHALFLATLIHLNQSLFLI